MCCEGKMRESRWEQDRREAGVAAWPLTRGCRERRVRAGSFFFE